MRQPASRHIIMLILKDIKIKIHPRCLQVSLITAVCCLDTICIHIYGNVHVFSLWDQHENEDTSLAATGWHRNKVIYNCSVDTHKEIEWRFQSLHIGGVKSLWSFLRRTWALADVGLLLWDCSLGLLRLVGSTNACHQSINKGRRMGRFCIISCFWNWVLV